MNRIGRVTSSASWTRILKMEKLYQALRLYKKDTRAIRSEMSKPAADNEARRNIFSRVDRMFSNTTNGEITKKVTLVVK